MSRNHFPTNAAPGSSAFLLLFRGSQWDNGLSPEEIQQTMEKVMAWFESLQNTGVAKGGHPLGDQGSTVSGRKGRTIVDGPFAESKENIGGYLMIEAEDLAAATEIARSFPTLDYGVSIEVRPVLEECPILHRMKETADSVSA
jgi:hypothetical protein